MGILAACGLNWESIMLSFRFWQHPAVTLFCALLLLVLPLAAQAATTVSGTVVNAANAPVKGALLTLAGSNRTLQTYSASDGSFHFTAIVDGEYELRASAPDGSVQAHLAVAAAPLSIVLKLSAQTIGRVLSVSSAPTLRSGGSTLISGAQLAHSPASNNLANVFVQLPSAARGSNGQIHINGDHGDINYSLDGVPLPQELNRVIGSEVDPSAVGFLDVIEGAYPAKYGGKFGAVVNIATVSGAGVPGGAFSTTVGSYGHDELSLVQHDRFGRGGGISVALRSARMGWALDPPVPNPNYDDGSA